MSRNLARIRKLSAVCQFEDMLQEKVGDCMVCDINSDAVQGKLLAEADLSLDKGVEIAVAMEMTETMPKN